MVKSWFICKYKPIIMCLCSSHCDINKSSNLEVSLEGASTPEQQQIVDWNISPFSVTTDWTPETVNDVTFPAPPHTPHLVGVRHLLAAHVAALTSLRHGWHTVGGQRLLLTVSSVLLLHHGVSVVLLLLSLLLTTGVTGEIGPTAARLDGRKDRRKRWWLQDLIGRCSVTVILEAHQIPNRGDVDGWMWWPAVFLHHWSLAVKQSNCLWISQCDRMKWSIQNKHTHTQIHSHVWLKDLLE